MALPSFTLVEDREASKSEHFGGTNIVRDKKEAGVCCSCSKKSLCKTTKCRCRSNGGSCGKSCGCALSKCTNREAAPVKLSYSLELEMAGSSLNCSGNVMAEKNGIAASEGAMLLQKELDEKSADMNENLRPRKEPLCDIGNILVRFSRQICHLPKLGMLRGNLGNSMVSPTLDCLKIYEIFESLQSAQSSLQLALVIYLLQSSLLPFVFVFVFLALHLDPYCDKIFYFLT